VLTGGQSRRSPALLWCLYDPDYANYRLKRVFDEVWDATELTDEALPIGTSGADIVHPICCVS